MDHGDIRIMKEIFLCLFEGPNPRTLRILATMQLYTGREKILEI